MLKVDVSIHGFSIKALQGTVSETSYPTKTGPVRKNPGLKKVTFGIGNGLGYPGGYQ